MGAHEMILGRATECAADSLFSLSGDTPNDVVLAEIAPAMEFMATHCRLASIEAISTRFISEVSTELAKDHEAAIYNRAISDVLEFLGGKIHG